MPVMRKIGDIERKMIEPPSALNTLFVGILFDCYVSFPVQIH